MHALWTHNVFREPDHFPRTYDPPRHVIFPPTMPVSGAAWFGMMIVVPTLTVTKQRHKPVISALVARLVIPVAEEMS